MSYSVVRRPHSLSALGVAFSPPTVELPPCDISTGSDAVDKAFKQCCEDAKAQLKIRGVTPAQVAEKIKTCTSKALDAAAQEKACNSVQTGIYYIDKGFTTCCQGAWKGSGSIAERTKKLAECTATATGSAFLTATFAGAATGLCVAAGTVTFGITTALAATGVCGIIGGTVGSFLYNRISGYSTQSLVLGIWAGAVCGAISGGTLAVVCGFAMAELVEWISDAVGPFLESVFDPNAAKQRARAERLALHHARSATQESATEAEFQITDQWKATVNRIWDLYETLFPSAADRTAALAATGITNAYESIARALLAASKRFPTQAEIDRYHGFDAALANIAPKGNGAGFAYTLIDGTEMARLAAGHQAACEVYGRPDKNGNFGSPSQLCPPLTTRDFYAGENDPSVSKTVDYYKNLTAAIFEKIQDYFALLPMAETYVANRLTTYSVVRQLDLLQKAAADKVTKQNNAGLYQRTVLAASKASFAARDAKSWSGDKRRQAIERADASTRVAWEAAGLVTTEPIKSKALAVAAKAASFANDARSNAQMAQFQIAGTAAVGIAGTAYLLFGRK